MVNTQAYFENIQEVILREISLSKKSILVAVAWFVDKALFEALKEALNRNVQVEVCLMDDEINLGPKSLPWQAFEAAGGKVFFKKENLMHNKFCVIDGTDVISGSYNWTNKAANYNDENIIITSGDYALANSFVSEFKHLTNQEKKQNAGPDINKILKRLQVIINLIELEEKVDIAKQAARLKDESQDKQIGSLANLLLQGRYKEGLDVINNFVKQYSQITHYVDPMISALRLEIKMLEYEIVALENERTESEKQLREFDLAFQKILGHVLEAILRIKKENASKYRQESQYTESEYQEAKRRYEEQARQREEAEKEQEITFELTEDLKTDLKKIHRQAVLLCHPDKVDPKDGKEAEVIFDQLTQAYKRQDYLSVAKIYDQLKRGWFSLSTDEFTDVELLAKRKQELIKKRAKLYSEIENMQSSEGWKIMQSGEPVEAYLENKKELLAQELNQLKALYATEE